MALVKVINGSYELQAGEAGLFIPMSALKGLDIGEIDPNDGSISEAVRQSKAIYAIIDRIAEYVLDPMSKVLGVTAAKGNLTGASASTFNVPYTFTVSSLVNLQDSLVEDIPIPNSGANANTGAIPLNSLFSSASYLDVGNLTQYSGLLILYTVGDGTQPYLDFLRRELTDPVADARVWVQAFLEAAAQYPNLTRATGIQSAFVARSVGTVNSTAIPPAMIAATNPTSGILSTVGQAIITRSYAFTVQFALNAATQSYDVAVV